MLGHAFECGAQSDDSVDEESKSDSSSVLEDACLAREEDRDIIPLIVYLECLF